MASLLWAVALILVVLWLVAVVVNIGGLLIHLLLLGALVVIAYNLLINRRGAR